MMDKSRARLQKIWYGMKQRCYNKNHTNYHRYGGRGITMCDEWLHNFQAFYDWAMANGYADNLTIDRMNNDGNYEPFNCRWATQKEQNNNKSNNHLITYDGVTKDIKEWSEYLGIDYVTLFARITAGWSVEKAFFEPVERSFRNRYDEVPHIDGENKRDREKRVKEYRRRSSGILTREERNRIAHNNVMNKVQLIRAIMIEQPDISIRQLAKVTGIPKSTVGRLVKKHIAE